MKYHETTTVNDVEAAKKRGIVNGLLNQRNKTGRYEDFEISAGNDTLSIDKRLLFTALVVSLFVV